MASSVVSKRWPAGDGFVLGFMGEQQLSVWLCQIGQQRPLDRGITSKRPKNFQCPDQRLPSPEFENRGGWQPVVV